MYLYINIPSLIQIDTHSIDAIVRNLFRLINNDVAFFAEFRSLVLQPNFLFFCLGSLGQILYAAGHSASSLTEFKRRFKVYTKELGSRRPLGSF